MASPWLLILDNMDDMLHSMISTSRRVSMVWFLVTTRSRDVALSVDVVIVELHEMSLPEAKMVLQRWLPMTHPGDNAAVEELLGELTYLPLAITQAGAYIKRNQTSIATYLGLLRGTEKDMVSLLSREFLGLSAIATTWLVSFDQIQRSNPAAANLLAFISQIEPKAIPQSILPVIRSEEQMVKRNWHTSRLCLPMEWHGRVRDAQPRACSDKNLDQKRGCMEETETEAIKHLSANFLSDDGANREKWRSCLPHALWLLQRSKDCHMQERYDLYFKVGVSLHPREMQQHKFLTRPNPPGMSYTRIDVIRRLWSHLKRHTNGGSNISPKTTGFDLYQSSGSHMPTSTTERSKRPSRCSNM